jgi:hypothetical protein
MSTVITKHSTLVIAVCFLLFIGQVVAYIVVKSPAFDEPNWLSIGWYITHHWTWQGDYHVFMHPPFTFYLHGIPLRLFEWWLHDPARPVPEGERATQFPYPYAATLSYNMVFTVAKFCMLPVSLVLGLFIYLWAKHLYGVSAALFALSLYVLNPLMLAHAAIIGTDMTITCGMFVTAYFFWRFTKAPSGKYILLTGVALGLTLLTRVSAVLLFPIFGILGLLILVYNHQASRKKTHNTHGIQNVTLPNFKSAGKKMLFGSLMIIGIALVVVEAGYLFDMQPVRSFRPEQEQDMIARLLKDIPIPFGAYINSIRLPQSFLFWMERPYFFAGQHLTSPVWYYNVVAFIVKNPVGLTIFLVLSLWSLGKYGKRLDIAELFLVFPGICLFGFFSLMFPVAGLRFALPFYPFLLVWTSRLVSWHMLKKTSIRVLFGGLMGWYALSTLAAAPDYLSYCNELVGGAKQGYKWFVDSDYDWGQDLKGLGKYVNSYQIPVIKLAYFGTGIPEYYGIPAIPLQEPGACQPTDGVIAVSATYLQGLYIQNSQCYDWLKRYEPLERIGNSVFVYAIEKGKMAYY